MQSLLRRHIANTILGDFPYKKKSQPCVVSSGELPAHNPKNHHCARHNTPLPPHAKKMISPTPSTKSSGKAKTKTRPDFSVVVQPERAISIPANGANIATNDRISVCEASMDVFFRMFKSHGKHSNSNLRFGEFVKAMVDAKFGAMWTSNGSAVVFEDSRGHGAIRIHQSHPDPSINPVMLRSLGKRMAKRFGWSFDTFVEV